MEPLYSRLMANLVGAVDIIYVADFQEDRAESVFLTTRQDSYHHPQFFSRMISGL